MGKNKQNYNSCLWISRDEKSSLTVMEIGGKLQGRDLESL